MMQSLRFIRGALRPLLILRINSPARILTRRLLILVLMASSQSVVAESFTSLKVLQSGINSARSCLALETEGVCIHFYIRCSLFGGCGVKTKVVPRISHNLPDLVVTAFREPGETPYSEIRQTYSVPAKRAVDLLMGESSSGGSSPLTISQSMIYNEVNVIGSPVVNQVKATLQATRSLYGFLCDSQVTPMKPYFMSEYDAVAWRHAEANIRLESLTPGQREIGTNLLKTWGSVHPRIGFVMQNQPPKAAAVASQRAIDVVSKTNQYPHVYSPYAISGHPEKRIAWQMIAPVASRGCEQFGAEGEWSEGKQSIDDDGDFAWNYWTRYDCCGPKPRWTFHTQIIRF